MSIFFQHQKHILNINKVHFAHMNNTAERAVPSQRSHPLPPDAHKTNALLQDRVKSGRGLQAGLTRRTCPGCRLLQRKLSVRFTYHDAIACPQRGSTFVMATCII